MNLKKRVINGGVVAVSMAILTAVTSLSSTMPANAKVAVVQDETEVVEDTRTEVATIEKKSVDVVTATKASLSDEETSSDPDESEITADQVSVSVGVNAEAAKIAASQAEKQQKAVKAADTTEKTTAAKEDAAEDSEKEAAESEKTEEAEDTTTENAETSVWDTRLMANVEDSLNVRMSADENAELAGKLYRGAIAEVVEKGDTWTHIKSGNVDGYVKNEYCVFGADAENLANQVCTTYATAVTGGLRVRSEANTESEILTLAEEGQKLTVNTAANTVEGWVAVDCEGVVGYISAEFVTTDLDVKVAVTMEEEAARIKAEEEAKAAEEAAAAKKAAEEAAAAAQSQAAASTTQSAPVAASYDETTLLGALIQCEAGGESYEGKVAVGAVVMNRVRSGSYPSSISGVINQGGQFTTAGSAASLAASGGVSSSCLQAAQEALNGANNVGGATSFRNVSSGIAGLVIGNHVFF